MRRAASPWAWTIVALSALFVIGLVVAIRSGALPRGVRGEWEWPFLPSTISRFPAEPVVATVGLAGFFFIALMGASRLARRSRPGDEALWLAALALGAIAGQVGLMAAAPTGYGLAKWVTIDMHGPSGYFTIARTQMSDVRRFLRDYPTWIEGQDALHIGTHPPGLFLVSKGTIALSNAGPRTAGAVADALPNDVTEVMRAVIGPRPAVDRAAIALIGVTTLLCCALTVVPLYFLARATLDAPHAFATAALWPLMPSAVMFQPAADTAFPLQSATAIALAAWSARDRGLGLGVPAGIVLAIGMQFSLVFLGVGLVVGASFVLASELSWKGRLASLLATGAGFLAATLAWWAITHCDPFLTWWANQRHHQRFYQEYPRSYGPWLVANPIELAIGLGLPVTLWLIAGLPSWRASKVSWITIGVLVLLTVSGRNLSEVGRLWLPFMPALMVAAGVGMERLKAGPAVLGATLALLAAQTLALQATIQVVYPF
jgi:hypothetical protein